MPSIKTIFLKSIACLVGAVVLDSAGAGLRLTQLDNPQSYLRLVPSFIVVLLTIQALEKYHRRLEARYDWIMSPRKRFLLQVVLGGVTLYAAMFVLVLVEFSFKENVEIYCVPWLIHMNATVLALVMVANAGFVLTTFYQKLQQADRILKRDFPNYMGLL
jgi:hypothetical protein